MIIISDGVALRIHVFTSEFLRFLVNNQVVFFCCLSEFNVIWVKLTSNSNVAGSDAVLNFALDPNVSGADQCRACANGLPRTSKLWIIIEKFVCFLFFF